MSHYTEYRMKLAALNDHYGLTPIKEPPGLTAVRQRLIEVIAISSAGVGGATCECPKCRLARELLAILGT